MPNASGQDYDWLKSKLFILALSHRQGRNLTPDTDSTMIPEPEFNLDAPRLPLAGDAGEFRQDSLEWTSIPLVPRPYLDEIFFFWPKISRESFSGHRICSSAAGNLGGASRSQIMIARMTASNIIDLENGKAERLEWERKPR